MIHGKPATDHTDEKISSLALQTSTASCALVRQSALLSPSRLIVEFWLLNIVQFLCKYSYHIIHVLQGHIVNLPSAYLCSYS